MKTTAPVVAPVLAITILAGLAVYTAVTALKRKDIKDCAFVESSFEACKGDLQCKFNFADFERYERCLVTGKPR